MLQATKHSLPRSLDQVQRKQARQQVCPDYNCERSPDGLQPLKVPDSCCVRRPKRLEALPAGDGKDQGVMEHDDAIAALQGVSHKCRNSNAKLHFAYCSQSSMKEEAANPEFCLDLRPMALEQAIKSGNKPPPTEA
eukprot:gb/GFBE01041774.1/.p1 GENE.gb/GFBE01041774.1/~~gb/GFBE01041774.1/.p1  ORF type:complete len:136 (+),score=20.71 gb/GFBE01041774.1/:1-408(+)